MKSKAGKIAIATLVILTLAILLVLPFGTQAATYQLPPKTLTISAVDSTPLDGTTDGREYTYEDRTASACVELQPETDGVVITAWGTGAASTPTVTFSIWGYDKGTGNAEMIYSSVTGTAGTADYSSTGHFIGTFSGTDVHCAAGGVTISDSGNNRVAKISFDTMGYRYLLFEVTALTNLTDVTFYVRQIGYK